MTYTMVKKSIFRFSTERYFNIVRKGYKDCNLNDNFLKNDFNKKVYLD